MMIELEPYEASFQARLEALHQGLSSNLDQISVLEPSAVHAILTYCLELACNAQHYRNIELGRTALWSLLRPWLLTQIDAVAEPFLQSEDEWVYRRLLEVYWTLDRELTRRLATAGRTSSNPDVRDAAEECLGKLEDSAGRQPRYYWEA